MRTPGQIQHQLKQVIYRHLQKKLRENFKQRPTTCIHNQDVRLTGRSSVHLCGYLSAEGVPRHVPCDDRIPGCSEMARKCPLWEPLNTKEDVKAEFHALIQSKDRGVIAAEYPDVAALLWVLDDVKDIPSEAEIEEVITQVEDDTLEERGWWSRLRRGLRGNT